MRIKELKKTVNLSWSPAEHYPVLLAAGTAAQQVDASFSPSSHLELYSLNLGDSSQDLELKSSLQTQHKFHKLVWSGAGVIVGGCDDGLLEFYNADKLLNNANDALIGTSNKHKGHVSSLDVNPYQKNLLASGASESEIFIWDLNNTSQPMAPGNRSQPYDHVQEVAWNQQVQHILGSTFSTRCVVWDLRKNEPIMKLCDPQSRTRWSSVAWHPSVATQLCLASEDDQSPVIQLWDLRLASSPLKTLDGHQLGVLSLSWCQQDPNILLSAGKDGLVNCYNPNESTGVALLSSGGSVGADAAIRSVQTCARAPALLATAALRAAAVHSLLGCAHAPQNVQSQNNIMESFGGALSSLPAVSRAAPPAPPPQPPRAPAWLARRGGGRFAFGGKLVTIQNSQDAATPKQVVISQVVSDPGVVEQSNDLDEVLSLTSNQDPAAQAALADYCRARGDACTAPDTRLAWFVLRAHFTAAFRDEVLNLLGFKQEDISFTKDTNEFAGDDLANNIAGLNVEGSGDAGAELSADTNTDLSSKPAVEKKLDHLEIPENVRDIVIPDGDDKTSNICRAMVCGDLEQAVELCLAADRTADAMLIAALGSQELLYKVQRYHLQQTSSDPVSLLAGCVLTSQLQRICSDAHVDSWRPALAAIVTYAPPETKEECCTTLGERALSSGATDAALLCFVAGRACDAAVRAWRGAGADVALLLRCVAGGQSGPHLDGLLARQAWQLAAQGCLPRALRLLQLLRPSELRDRVLTALAGSTGSAQQQPQQQQQPQSGPHRPRTVSSHRRSVTHSEQTNNYNTVAAAAALEGPQWSRPASAATPSGGITSRSKYKVDPSVQSAPSYNQYNYNNPVTSQPQNQYGYNNGPDPYSNPIQNNYANAPMNPINPAFNPVNPPLNPINPAFNAVNQPINPINQFTPVNPPLNPINPAFNPANAPLNPSMQPMNPTLNPMNPSLNPLPGSLNPAMNGGPAPVTRNPVVPPAAPGWNDPPMLSSKPKPKAEVQAQAPITHPLFGMEPPQHVPLAGHPGQQYPNQGQQYPGQGQQYPGQGQQFLGQGQQFPGHPDQQGYPEQQYQGQFDQQYQGQFQSMNMQRASPAPASPPPPLVKPPLPAEHAPLQASFDGLRAECAARASNPQMKRKLEDVQRRLEAMYDMLREYRLSESALASLHSCSQSVISGDYDSSLHIATSLATTPDFASVASFLPGLKVLFQIAKQLQVYVR